MSELKVSPGAITHIREIIVSRAIAWPVVMADWNTGPADVTRGSSGDVLWEREPASWRIWVHDMDKFYALMVTPEQRAQLTKGTEKLSGLRFRVRGKPDNPALFGCTLDLVADKLTVREDSVDLFFPQGKKR